MRYTKHARARLNGHPYTAHKNPERGFLCYPQTTLANTVQGYNKCYYSRVGRAIAYYYQHSS